jgi:hypothetical protein
MAESAGIGGEVKIDPGPVTEKDFSVEEKIPNGGVPLADKVARCAEYREKLQGMDGRIVNAVAMYAGG